MICTYGDTLRYCKQYRNEWCMCGKDSSCTHPRIGGTPKKLEAAAREAQEAGIDHYVVLTGKCGAVFVIPIEHDEDGEEE